MAHSQRRKGYPLEIFQNDTLDLKFLCTICKLVLRNPVQMFCGDRYCKDCADDARRTGNDMICPGCAGDEPMDVLEKREIFPDNALKREMAKLKVHCSQLNCEWTGIFQDFVEHFEEHFITAAGNACPFGCRARLDEGCVVQDHLTAALAQHFEILNNRLQTMETQFEKLTGDVQSMETILQLENESFNTMERKTKNLERCLEMKEKVIAELSLKVTCLEECSYDGTFLWRVSNVAKRRQEAVEGMLIGICSAPFYTSRTGYKLALKLCLNGDGAATSTHMSVFLIVMRSNYDALLQWPFRQLVTFVLVNQAGFSNITRAFRPDPSSSSFRRPVADMNTACGLASFVHLELLDDADKGFVKEDQLFLKVIVDVGDKNQQKL